MCRVFGGFKGAQIAVDKEKPKNLFTTGIVSSGGFVTGGMTGLAIAVFGPPAAVVFGGFSLLGWTHIKISERLQHKD
jgi:hypothetical protein